MKKTFKNCLLAAMFLAPFVAGAQVTIGSGDVPNATLDVVASTGTPAGVIAPRLSLSDLQTADSDYTTLQDGAIVYVNDATGTPDGKTANVTSVGYYYYDGTNAVWKGFGNGAYNAPVITTQPRAFNWKETIGAGNLEGIGGAAANISVTAVGSDLTYQWYELPRNQNAAHIPVTSANAASYTPVLTALGMRSYYCVVSNAFGSIKSDIANVAVGCGAMTADGTWRTFMCYNLGATATTLNQQMTTGGNVYHSSTVGAVPAGGYSGANAYSAVYGDLYQWGRVADGHQKRSSPNSTTTNTPAQDTYTGMDVAWSSGGSEQIASGQPNYGRFVLNSTKPYDWNKDPSGRNVFLWRNYRYTQNDPCANLGAAGTNWRVPTVTEWGSIFRGDEGAGAPTIAIPNTWTWKAPGTTTNGSTGTAGGYQIKPDGVTVTLFLPAAGYRHYSNGQLYYPGVDGSYWSTTAYGNYSHRLTFNSGNVIPALYNGRAHGFSLRCIAEL